MTHFSAWGVYLLLVPLGRVLIQKGIRHLFLFWKQQNIQNKALIFILKETTVETVKVTYVQWTIAW